MIAVCGRLLAKITGIAVLCALFTMIYWLYIDEHFAPVDEIVSPPFLSNTGSDDAEPRFVFQPGDTVHVHWHLFIHKLCPVNFTRFFLNTRDQSTIQLLSHGGTVQKPTVGKPERFSAEILLPLNMTYGAYEYRVRGTFNCNPVRAQVVDYPPIPFRVTGGAP